MKHQLLQQATPISVEKREIRIGARAATLVIGLALSLGLTACEDAAPVSDGSDIVRPAKMMVVRSELASLTRRFPGRVEASENSSLAFEVTGRIIDFPVREGQIVNKGELIAKLDPEDFQLAIRENEVKVKEWAVELDRATFLLSKGHIAQSAFDEKKAKYDLAVVGLDTAKRNLNYTNLRAPFTGRVASKIVQNHESITKGQPILTFEENDSIDIVVNVSETILASARQRDVVALIATFEAIKEREFFLKFKEVSTKPDPATQTYRLVLTMPVPSDVDILPGMTATVEATSISKDDAKSDVYYIPVAAVASDPDDRFYAWAVDDQGAVSKRYVEVGGIQGDSLSITSGLNDGDKIVTAGVNFITEGMKVRPLDEG